MGWQEILSSAPRADERNDVEYFEVEARRVLNPARLPWLPFDLTLNPYLQCELGCVYCYAREHAERRTRGAGEGAGPFDRRIYAKTGAPALLREELARLSRLGGLGGKEIALGTATDPYQPYERRARVTRALLEVFATVEDVRLSITTKSDLVLRDLDVLQAIGRRGHVQVNVTITTTDRDLARSLEPRAPTPARRLRAVEGLARAGVPVGIFCMPVLPELTEAPRDLRALVCAAREAGARWFAANVLFLRGDAVRAAFFGWLQGAFPALVPRYRRLYRGPGAPEAVTDRVARVVEALRRQYGLPASVPWPEPRAGPRQLSLFEGAPPEPAPEPPAPGRRVGRALPHAPRGELGAASA
ncbi:MAG: radical SAM protein [Planctomycetes bacterium]|nr:radical SAM protein [Planctomycetota bacterium]